MFPHNPSQTPPFRSFLPQRRKHSELEASSSSTDKDQYEKEQRNIDAPNGQKDLSQVQLNVRHAQICNTLNYQGNMTNILESYINIFSHGFPLLSRPLIEKLVHRVVSLDDSISSVIQRNQSSRARMSKKPPSQITSCKLLLYMAIQCFTMQRLGHKAIANTIWIKCQSFLNNYLSKEFIKQLFLDNEDKIDLACAFCTAAYYLAGLGGEEVKRHIAAFSNAAEYYIYQLKKPLPNLKLKISLVKKYLALVELCMKSRYFDYRDGIKCLQELLKGDTNRKISPPLNASDFQGNLSFVDQAEEALHSYWKNLSQSFIGEIIFHFYYRLLCNGIRLQLLYASHGTNIEFIYEFASKTIEDVQKHIMFFTYCPVPIQYIAFAARICLANVAKSGICKAKLLKHLKLCYYQLLTANTKFDIVGLEFGSIIKELNQVITNYNKYTDIPSADNNMQQIKLSKEDNNATEEIVQEYNNILNQEEKNSQMNKSVEYQSHSLVSDELLLDLQLDTDLLSNPQWKMEDNDHYDSSREYKYVENGINTRSSENKLEEATILWDEKDDYLIDELFSNDSS